MASESLVLVLYCGGTIGMIKQNEDSGFEPYPSFLTETLRSQSRFHDPVGDSIFSWSNTADRFKAWSDAYTTSPSGAATPSSSERTQTNVVPGLVQEAASRVYNARPPNLHHDSGIPIHYSQSSERATSHAQPAGPPFGSPVTVKSTSPNGVSKHHAFSTALSADGQSLELELPTLITPKVNGRRIRYVVLEYDPLLDSSDMDIPDWIRIARDIQANYRSGFDGFVVLHGTDTMAYTSSALSFLLENLGKTVIVTGAQVPLSQLRNDAIENMLGALLLAGSYTIPEVTLYFASKLYRGNRASKVSNNALAAFDSPNMPALANVSIAIDVNWTLVERPREIQPFRAHDRMSSNVAVLRLFPGLSTATVRAFLAPPLEGAVLESYGAGNAPSRPDLLEVFKEATERGLVIVNITQCVQGEVSAIYSLGKKLEAVGVVPGADMTPECALAKLSYLLSKNELSRGDVRDMLRRPLRGELTLRNRPRKDISGSDTAEMGSLLAHILHGPQQGDGASHARGSEADVTAASEVSQSDIATASYLILPYLIHRAASANDTPSLQWHLSALAKLQDPAVSHTSTDLSPAIHVTPAHAPLEVRAPLERAYPLHAAAALCHVETVELLVRAGANVHAKDLGGSTPLFLALRGGHGRVARLLREAGAHLGTAESDVAVALLRAGVVQPELWSEAGVAA